MEVYVETHPEEVEEFRQGAIEKIAYYAGVDRETAETMVDAAMLVVSQRQIIKKAGKGVVTLVKDKGKIIKRVAGSGKLPTPPAVKNAVVTPAKPPAAKKTVSGTPAKTQNPKNAAETPKPRVEKKAAETPKPKTHRADPNNNNNAASSTSSTETKIKSGKESVSDNLTDLNDTSRVKKINGRMPMNHQMANKVYPLEKLPLKPDNVRHKYPHSVPFTGTGHPDFSRYATKKVEIKMTGLRRTDDRLANLAAGYKETPKGYTWHHHQDGKTMMLVPKDLHRAVDHTGGVAIVKHKSKGQ